MDVMRARDDGSRRQRQYLSHAACEVASQSEADESGGRTTLIRLARQADLSRERGRRASCRAGASREKTILTRLRLSMAVLASLVGTGVVVGTVGHGAVAQSTDPAAKAALCATCHGSAGVPLTKDIPVIWGQHAGYIFIQLRDYATGARKSPVMEPIAKTLNRQDRLALAEYFEQKPWPDLGQKRASAATIAQAERIATSGQCTQCHLGGYLGDSTNPRLAGQSVTYLRQTMLAFHSGERGNNPWMNALLKTYSEGDIGALAAYLAGL